jgi:hypothetical protein
VLFTGVVVKASPLQVALVMLEIAGLGLTVTINVKVEPAQVPEVGVTVYVAVWGVLVGLVKVPVMLAAPDPAAPPVSPPVTVGADQE